MEKESLYSVTRGEGGQFRPFLASRDLWTAPYYGTNDND